MVSISRNMMMDFNNNGYNMNIIIHNKNLMGIVDYYQPIYLNKIDKHIIDNLNIQINKDCKFMAEFLKACHKKGLTKSDIDKYYYYYYVKFKIT